MDRPRGYPDRLRALAESLHDHDLFDVVVDALSGAYPMQLGDMPRIAVRELAASAIPRLLHNRQRFVRYRDALLSDGTVTSPKAWFALLPELNARAATEARYDRLVASALAVDPEQDGRCCVRSKNRAVRASSRVSAMLGCAPS
jgi:hypothetical protein